MDLLLIVVVLFLLFGGGGLLLVAVAATGEHSFLPSAMKSIGLNWRRSYSDLFSRRISELEAASIGWPLS